MIETEKAILNFITSYFSTEELNIMKQNPVHQGNNNTIITRQDLIDYKKLSEFFFKIFNLKPDMWDLQTDESGSAIIDKLLHTFCTKKSMLCKTRENYGEIIYNLIEQKDVFVYTLQDLYNETDHIKKDYNKWIENIINEFYKSKSKSLFILIPRMIPGFGYLLNQNFFTLLKKRLVAAKIEHIIILDDCQAGFYVDSSIDYELFDGFFTTAHLYFPGLSGALLFIKNKKVAYKDLKFLQEFQPKMEILYHNKDKAIQFNTLLNNYFSDIASTNLNICKNELFPKHQFIIHCQNIKPIPKYCKNLFSNYLIRMFEADVPTCWLRIRFEEALIQDPYKFINGLKTCKKYLKRLEHRKYLSIINSSNKDLEKMYDDSKVYENVIALYKGFYNKQSANTIMLDRIKNTFIQYKMQLTNTR